MGRRWRRGGRNGRGQGQAARKHACRRLVPTPTRPRPTPSPHPPPQVVDTLATSFTPPHAVSLTAFYSSELGGVTTEPGLFVIHADDHGFHRGHAVFDTVEIIEGCAYDLDAHLTRFFASAEAARLDLPCTRAQVRRIVLETAAAGRALDGHVRYWLAAGRGGLSLTPRACAKPSLFAMAYKTETVVSPDHEIPGCTLHTATTVFAPDTPFATMKSTNYLRNVLAQMEAEDAGYDHAIFVNREGFVTDGSTVSVGVITKQGELVVPPADVGLASCTAARVLELVPRVSVFEGGCGWVEAEWGPPHALCAPPSHTRGAGALLSSFRGKMRPRFYKTPSFDRPGKISR